MNNILEDEVFSPEAISTLNTFSEYLDYIKYLQDELLREDTDDETYTILMEDYTQAMTTLKELKDDCRLIIESAIVKFTELGYPVRLEYYKLLKTLDEFEKVNAHVLKDY